MQVQTRVSSFPNEYNPDELCGYQTGIIAGVWTPDNMQSVALEIDHKEGPNHKPLWEARGIETTDPVTQTPITFGGFKFDVGGSYDMESRFENPRLRAYLIVRPAGVVSALKSIVMRNRARAVREDLSHLMGYAVGKAVMPLLFDLMPDSTREPVFEYLVNDGRDLNGSLRSGRRPLPLQYHSVAIPKKMQTLEGRAAAKPRRATPKMTSSPVLGIESAMPRPGRVYSDPAYLMSMFY